MELSLAPAKVTSRALAIKFNFFFRFKSRYSFFFSDSSSLFFFLLRVHLALFVLFSSPNKTLDMSLSRPKFFTTNKRGNMLAVRAYKVGNIIKKGAAKRKKGFWCLCLLCVRFDLV
jgi:hypothetical protein